MKTPASDVGEPGAAESQGCRARWAGENLGTAWPEKWKVPWMDDLVMSLVSSVVAGSAVWLGQRLLRYRRLARKRGFFGVSRDASCVLVAPRHASSPNAASVHRRDMAALVELAAVVSDGGGRADVVTESSGLYGGGRVTEFCVGGPVANPRTGAHLRALLPGVVYALETEAPVPPTFSVGTTEYPPSSESAEYGLLAKVYLPGTNFPVFILSGQTARTNLAAARLLSSQYRKLLRTYGASGRFCLVVRVLEPNTYGPDLVEIMADVTDVAFRAVQP